MRNVGRHQIARLRIRHAELRLQPQARQWRAQVVRDAGQHDGAVLFDLRQRAGHAIELPVDGANLAPGAGLAEHAAGEIALTDPRSSLRQVLQWAVDQAGKRRRARQRQGGRDDEPDDPGGARRRVQAGAIGEHPVAVAVDGKTHPQPGFAIHAGGQHRLRAQATLQLARHALGQGIVAEHLETVVRLARQDAYAFLLGHGLDKRNPGDGVGMHQRGPAQVHQRGNLLRQLHRARLQLEHAQRLQPRHDAEQQQHRQQAEGAPEQAQAGTPLGRLTAGQPLQRGRAALGCQRRCLRCTHVFPSGTNTYPTPHTVWM